MSAFVAAESAANPAAIRAAAADLDRVAGMITGHGQAVTAALDTAPPTFSDLFAEQLRGRVRDNEAAWRSALSSVVYAAGVTRAWAADVEWFKAQQRALGAQVAAATAGTAGLTAPAITPGAPPETIANSLQQFSAAVDTRRAELNAQGSHASGALLSQLQERAAQRAADLRSGPTPVALDRLDVAGALPGAASSIFAGTGWTPARPVADLLALVTAGLLPGSALTMNWKDLISKVIGEWAHLLDRSHPTIPDGSPLAGAFVPGVDPQTGVLSLRPDFPRLADVFAGIETSVALLLGGLYPRLFISGGPGIPASTQQVAQASLLAAGTGHGAGGGKFLAAVGSWNLAVGSLATAVTSALTSRWATSVGKFLSNGIANFLAKPWTGPGVPPWIDNGNKHTGAQEVSMAVIKQEVLARGGDPDNVTLEYRIEGASKKKNGNDGFADIVYRDGLTTYVWEVKGTSSDAPPLLNQATLAEADMNWYIGELQKKENALRSGVTVTHGWPLATAIPLFYYTNQDVANKDGSVAAVDARLKAPPGASSGGDDDTTDRAEGYFKVQNGTAPGTLIYSRADVIPRPPYDEPLATSITNLGLDAVRSAVNDYTAGDKFFEEAVNSMIERMIRSQKNGYRIETRPGWIPLDPSDWFLLQDPAELLHANDDDEDRGGG